MASGFEVCFGFEFGAAELSLEKFRNALNWLRFGSRACVRRGKNFRQKDERLKHSRWPAHALPFSRKLITTARPPCKQQSAV